LQRRSRGEREIGRGSTRLVERGGLGGGNANPGSGCGAVYGSPGLYAGQGFTDHLLGRTGQPELEGWNPVQSQVTPGGPSQEVDGLSKWIAIDSSDLDTCPHDLIAMMERGDGLSTTAADGHTLVAT
jgi:hypothetical protein